MKQFFLGIMTCFLFTCCQVNQRENPYIPLQADDSLTFFVGLPVEIAFYKNYLFVHDFFGEEGLIGTVDPSKDSKLFSFLNKGGGPNEIVSLSNLDLFMHKGQNLFGLFDVNTKKYRSYNTDSILLNQTNLNPFLEKNVEIPYSINELRKTARGYVATGFFPDGKFALLNDSLELIQYVGQYRPQENKSVSPLLHAQANIGTSGLSPDGKRLANVIFHGGVVELYTIDADTVIKQWEFLKNELDYDVKNGRQILNKGVEGFISVDMTDHFVFALYSGNKFDVEEVATYGKYVYQFDLNGNLVEIYELDREVFDIYIDDNGLKAIVHVPEPMIVSYKIKK